MRYGWSRWVDSEIHFHHERVQAPDCDSCSSCCLHFLGGKWQEKKEKEEEGWKEEKRKQEG